MPENPTGPDLTKWVGKTETHEDTIDAKQANLMAATLGYGGHFSTGDPLPPLWHWAYFLTALPADQLGRDGHPKRGGFLPPVPLPRRMSAGGSFTFFSPLRIGETIRKTSTIRNVVEKEGRSGPLCFVTAKHVFSADDIRFRETHDIVYREDPKGPQPTPPRPTGTAEAIQEITPSSTLLFRYSALTFNGHRIHYDQDYAKEVEGYPGLVTHGPLIATLLASHACAQQSGKALTAFAFRARSPICGPAPFRICSTEVGTNLWAETAEGALAMTAEATF